MPAGAVRAGGPSWLEPRALNIVDLVGQVPDDVLRGTIISAGGPGAVVFESSSPVGDAWRIRATLYGRVAHPGWLQGQPLTFVGALGQMADFDNMGSASPESWLRLYNGSQELTNRLELLSHNTAQLMQPLTGAGEWQRYPRLQVSPLRFTAEGLYIPANTGADIALRGDYPVLTGDYTVRPRNRPRVRYLGTQQATWQTYIGPGAMGYLTPLMTQMENRYGRRHHRILLEIPAGANYILFIYPLSPGDPYSDDPGNRPRLVAGTVRLSPDHFMLTADFRHSGPFPLRVGWQDADQVLYTPYLSLLRNFTVITPPEVVLPEGMPYDPCYTQGNCPDAILQRIYDARMPIRIVYLSVQPPDGQFSFVPLRMADDTWTPAMASVAAEAGPGPARAAGSWRLYLPGILNYRVPAAGCPCGAFEPGGRMVYYVE